MIKVNQTAFGVVTAIKEDGEYKFLILLQSIKFENWSCPKGKSEEGETVPLDIAMRELKEETGITEIEILDCPLIDENYDFEKDGKFIVRVTQYFVGIVKDKKVTPQEGEILDYKWATYEEAMETFVFKKEDRQGVLRKAKEYLDEYESRK
jgi:8-oxo-dGTP pyrophosphatase MutT (NUDIX family)